MSRKKNKNGKVIKELISRVNSTLGYYEDDYISVKRTPESEQERCKSFEDYIEARFNFECCKIPELRNAAIAMDGHLFILDKIIEPDLTKRRFKKVSLVLVGPELISDVTEEFITELESVKNFIGGRVIEFNNVKQKIKFNIYD